MPSDLRKRDQRQAAEAEYLSARKVPLSWAFVERVTRVELAFSAWEADVLPLNYTRRIGDTLVRAGVWVQVGNLAGDGDG